MVTVPPELHALLRRQRQHFARTTTWIAASVYSTKGSLMRPSSAFDEAIHLDSRCVRAYHNRGVAWIVKGELNRAIEDFDEAVRLNPEYAAAYANRGLAYEKKGDKANAKRNCARAEQLGMSIGSRD